MTARTLTTAALATLVVSPALSGCTAWMRDADFYAEELEALVETRTESVELCYDRYLEAEAEDAKGEVVVEFEVAEKTGALEKVSVVSADAPAPSGLAECVTAELDGLALDPPDANRAQATFTWNFAPGSRKKQAADPFGATKKGVLDCYSRHLAEVDREAQGTLTIDYAMNPETGAVSTIEVVADQTTAPEAVVECATEALMASAIPADKVEERNAQGRRTFTLRFEPYQVPEAAPAKAEAAPADTQAEG